MTRNEQIEQFIKFLEERPACNRKCRTISNLVALRHEINLPYLKEHGTYAVLAVDLHNFPNRTLDELILNLKEFICQKNS